jgi:hypothetical protein
MTDHIGEANEMMTQERLEEIRKRCEAATPGKWEIEGAAICSKTGVICLMTGDNDAVFIVHTRQDIPDLLGEVERLRSEINRAAPFLAVHGFEGYRFEFPTIYEPTETRMSNNVGSIGEKEG